MPSARAHRKLSLEDVWDLEDQFTALAGSASGVHADVLLLVTGNAREETPLVRETTPNEISLATPQRLEKGPVVAETKKATRGAKNPQPSVTSLQKPTDTRAQSGIYIEKRAKGDYAVRRSGSERASAIEPTQREAIERAREIAPHAAIHVERVRDTPERRTDKWRSP